MSARLDAVLGAEMARWESRGLRRDLDAQSALRVPRASEFSSNDVLSLADDPRVIEAAREALERHGAGGRAARLLGGGCDLDATAERALADWMRTESALLFPSGYQANLGLITALAGPGTALFSDELDHASIIDAARLARARVHVYRHLDVEHLDHLLATERGAAQRFVVTETVFSMDGDVAPLLELHELCARHGAYLLLDEAHATGVIGPEGAGGWMAVDPRNELGSSRESRLAARIVTGGKALGVSGAFVACSRALREHLANRARSFVFSTALSPAVSGALCASIDAARGASAARSRVQTLARRVAHELSLPVPDAAIVPFRVGSSTDAIALSNDLLRAGLDVRAVRAPTVPEGSARLRIVCHAHNSDAAVDALVTHLRSAKHTAQRIEARARARVLCVVGTDTGVGKTVVSALLARAALRCGPATYWKPVQTGTESDTDVVTGLCGADLVARAPHHCFELAASPHTAAAAAGARVDFDGISSALRTLSNEHAGTVIVELAGGLLVPYDDVHTQADLIARARPHVVLVARSGLGTLNHTLLTLEALTARGLGVRALILVGEPHAANTTTLRARTGLRVHHLAPLEPLDTAALDDWLEHNDVTELFA